MTLTAHKRKLVRADLERMNLPQEYWLSKVDEVSETVRPVVARYLVRIVDMLAEGAGLLIWGEKGTGKTTVAALVAKEARAYGYTVFFATVWELREMVRSRLGFDDDTSILERAREVDVLVLDDLRAEDSGEKFFATPDILDLVKYRWARRRVTLITTGMSLVRMDDVPGLLEGLRGALVPLEVTGCNLYEVREARLGQVVHGS